MSRLHRSVSRYFSFVKFSHTVFAMPFALIGFVIAVKQPGYEFSLRLLLLVILCMIFARNAAMGFNRLVDRKLDSINPRTQEREIPAGIIKPREAALFIALNALFFIISVGFINRLTLLLSPVALAVILGYSLTKRITYLCHFILGLGLSLAPIGAYISVTGKFELLPVIYSFIVLSWVSGFDIIYALQDDQFDSENRLYSLPSAFGRKKALVISTTAHIITIILIVAAGIEGSGNMLFWIGAFIFSALLIYQHSIIKPDDLSRVNMAFGTTNGVASFLFACFVIIDMIK